MRCPHKEQCRKISVLTRHHHNTSCAHCDLPGRSLHMFLIAQILDELKDMRTYNDKLKADHRLLLQAYKEMVHSESFPIP